MGLADWWLTAGAVFQNVWNAIDGRAPGYGIKDYDVFYFGGSHLSWAAEDAVIDAATDLFSDVAAAIELRNEARVHLWYEQKFGVPCDPFRSATDAIDAFAPTTCCVGITSDESGTQVYAPHGLKDVLAMHLRPNHRLAPRHVQEEKVRQYRARWPRLTSDPW